MKKILLWAGVLIGLVVLAALLFLGAPRIFHALGLTYPFSIDEAGKPNNNLSISWQQPDALIESESLAQLTQDFLQVPLAKELLTEDFLFFYEQNESYLSIKGAMRRIAYEHELQWSDKMLHSLMNEPSQLAMWRGGSGAIEHFAMVAERSVIASMLMELGKLQLEDENLKVVGSLDVGRVDVPIYALSYGQGRKLAFAAFKDRVLLASSVDMLINASELDSNAATVMSQLLGGDENVWLNSFVSNPNDETAASYKHSLLVHAHFLSMGYQQFFPALQGLRFDFGAKDTSPTDKPNWQTSAWLEPSLMGTTAVNVQEWDALAQYMPYDAAGCVSLPVQWSSLNKVVAGLDAQVQKTAEQLAQNLSGPLGVCWFQDGRLYSPVFMTELDKAADGSGQQAAAPDAAGVQGLNVAADLPVLLEAFFGKPESKKSGGTLTSWNFEWKLNGPQTAQVMNDGKLLVFSPEEKLVSKVQAVANNKQPALSDVLSQKFAGEKANNFLAYINSQKAAGLLEKETKLSLPRTSETTLRLVADEHLLPQLQKIGNMPHTVITVPNQAMQGASGWYPLQWHKLD